MFRSRARHQAYHSPSDYSAIVGVCGSMSTYGALGHIIAKQRAARALHHSKHYVPRWSLRASAFVVGFKIYHQERGVGRDGQQMPRVWACASNEAGGMLIVGGTGVLPETLDFWDWGQQVFIE